MDWNPSQAGSHLRLGGRWLVPHNGYLSSPSEKVNSSRVVALVMLSCFVLYRSSSLAWCTLKLHIERISNFNIKIKKFQKIQSSLFLLQVTANVTIRFSFGQITSHFEQLFPVLHMKEEKDGTTEIFKFKQILPTGMQPCFEVSCVTGAIYVPLSQVWN